MARLLTDAGTKIELSGDAEQPAKVSEGDTRSEVVLPKGSTIETVDPIADSPRKTTIILAENSPLVSVSKTRDVTGPRAFQPEKPPSPIEIARGQAVLWSYGLAGLLTLVGFGMLYLQHYKAGGFCLLGAIAVPVCASLLTNTVALAVGGGCLLIGLTLYGAWHLMQRNRQAFVATQTSIESLRVQDVPRS